ncbi:hypothetical protein BGK72_35500 [Streptomyces agglomeratus]|nr:hypothetical protein BGK72_35500 [Streptomyces agglomeratus]
MPEELVAALLWLLGTDGLIPLTCNEIQRLFTTLVVRPSAMQPTGSAGPPGDAATRPEPRLAITAT